MDFIKHSVLKISLPSMTLKQITQDNFKGKHWNENI